MSCRIHVELPDHRLPDGRRSVAHHLVECGNARRARRMNRYGKVCARFLSRERRSAWQRTANPGLEGGRAQPAHEQRFGLDAIRGGGARNW